MTEAITPAKLYGISNCDTVRKTKKWLDNNVVDYEFIDFRKDGIQMQAIQQWVDSAGLDKVLNKRGTTWRKLPESKQNFSTDGEAIQLLAEQPTLIKRPVLEAKGRIEIGFSETIYEEIF